jgi:long-subunit fatty acid transport protein
MRRLLIALLAAFTPAVSHAAGYDTPMLYSARHMGMGGAAVSYVADPSALFHNPAGVSRVRGGAVMANVSPLFGTLQASPNENAKSVKTEPTIAPLFLAGAAYRPWRGLVLGAAVFPAGSAAGAYKYPSLDGKTTISDAATLAFIEVAHAVAYELPYGLRLGASWRYTMATFQRKRDDAIKIDLDMSGKSTDGFRLGLQWSRGPLDVGVSYRNRIDLDVHADTGTLSAVDGEDISFKFIFPSKVTGGVQYRGIQGLRLALDVEYGFNSENNETQIRGAIKGTKSYVDFASYYEWADGITARVGGAYALGKAEVRAGYAHDRQVTQKKYPSAFGTPPAPTHIATVGVGYQLLDSLDVSLAGAYRTGSTTVTRDDLAKKTDGVSPKCAFCGLEGDYGINLFGAYLDVVWRFGEPKTDLPPLSAAGSSAGDAPFAPPAGTANTPPEAVQPEVKVEERKPDDTPLPEPKDKNARPNDPRPESESAPSRPQ